MAYPINTTNSPEFPEPLLVYKSMAASNHAVVAGEPYPPSMNGFAVTANQPALFRESIPPFSFWCVDAEPAHAGCRAFKGESNYE